MPFSEMGSTERRTHLEWDGGIQGYREKVLYLCFTEKKTECQHDAGRIPILACLFPQTVQGAG